MEYHLICAQLYVRGYGNVGVVELGLFDKAPVAITIEIEEGVPTFEVYGCINGVENPKDPKTIFTCFGRDTGAVCSKIIKALSDKLGITLLEAV